MTHQQVADQLRAAYAGVDMAAFGALLTDDVRWGDETHPNSCRSRSDVLNVFQKWIGGGVTADVSDIESTDHGVIVKLHVNWVDPSDQDRSIDFFHVFMLRGDQICEIRRYDDAESAREAIAA